MRRVCDEYRASTWRVRDEYTASTPRACENGKWIIWDSASTLKASSLNTQWPVAWSRRSVYEANTIAWYGFVHMLLANTRTKSYIGHILATTTHICNKCNVAFVYTMCLTIGINTILHVVHYTTTQLNCIGRSCSRHPFSGPVNAAGELLHTTWRISTSITTVLLSEWTSALYGIR